MQGGVTRDNSTGECHLPRPLSGMGQSSWCTPLAVENARVTPVPPKITQKVYVVMQNEPEQFKTLLNLSNPPCWRLGRNPSQFLNPKCRNKTLFVCAVYLLFFVSLLCFVKLGLLVKPALERVFQCLGRSEKKDSNLVSFFVWFSFVLPARLP